MPIAMIVHAGAWAIPDDQTDVHERGCQVALRAGWALLESGASALDACEAAVRMMENNPHLNAGTGAVLNSDGNVELDAAIMEGSALRYGAVANVRRVRNPISLARHILAGPGTMLVGAGAERFAQAHDIPLCDNEDLIVERELRLWQQQMQLQHATAEPAHTAAEAVPQAAGSDTVGAIAIDYTGLIIAANSTGGTPFKLPGRVGDTPLVGCGLYADNRVGACVCTGWGESITRMALARRAVEHLERGCSPQSAAEIAMRLLSRQVEHGDGGCVIVGPTGQVGLAWNTRRMAYAYQVEGEAAVSGT